MLFVVVYCVCKKEILKRVMLSIKIFVFMMIILKVKIECWLIIFINIIDKVLEGFELCYKVFKLCYIVVGIICNYVIKWFIKIWNIVIWILN